MRLATVLACLVVCQWAHVSVAYKLESGVPYFIRLRADRNCDSGNNFLGFYNRTCGSQPPKEVGPTLRAAAAITWRQWVFNIMGEDNNVQWGYMETYYPEERGKTRCVGPLNALNKEECRGTASEVATIDPKLETSLFRFVPLDGEEETYRIALKDRQGKGCTRFLSASKDCSINTVFFVANDVGGLQRWVITKVDPENPAPAPSPPTQSPTPVTTSSPTPTPTVTSIPAAKLAVSDVSFTTVDVAVSFSEGIAVSSCTVELSPGNDSKSISMLESQGSSIVSFTNLIPAKKYTLKATCDLGDGVQSPMSEALSFFTLGNIYDPPEQEATVCNGRGEIEVSGVCVCNEASGFVARTEGGCICNTKENFVDDGDGGCVCESCTPTGTTPPPPPPTTTPPPLVCSYVNVTASNGEDYGDVFGYSLDLNRLANKLVVGDYGAYSADDDYYGRAYVFGNNGSGWVEEAILSSGNDDDANRGEKFGFSVAISGAGDRVAVGDYEAMIDGEQSGKVYLYEKNGSEWLPGAILLPTALKTEKARKFGESIAANADGTVMVAADTRSFSQTNKYGIAQIFVHDGSQWNMVKTLSTGTSSSSFDNTLSVAINGAGDVIAVGNPKPSSLHPTYTKGLVYVYRNIDGDWIESFFDGSDTATKGALFGWSVSLNDAGDVLAVGDYKEDGEKGAVYIFNYNAGTENWDQEQKLVFVTRTSYDRFGYAIDLDDAGDTIAITAKGADSNFGVGSSNYYGRSYIYEKSGGSWTQAESFGFSGDRCGYGEAVALNGLGDVMAVSENCGFNNGIGNAGLVHVRRKVSGTWGAEEVIKADDPDFGHYFGTSVAVNDAGNLIAVGAPDAGSNDGKVYIFQYVNDQWNLVESFAGSDTGDGSDQSNFGASAALDASGSQLFVGDYSATNIAVGDSYGAAYVFQRNGETFVESDIIVPLDTLNALEFGYSLDMNDNGDVIVVGDEGADDNGQPGAGLAYVFMLTEGEWISHILSQGEDAASYNYFGISSAINAAGDIVAVGARSGPGGKVYVFEYNGSSWSLRDTVSPVVEKEEYFGDAVALNAAGDVMVVGDDGVATESGDGVAYVFRYDGSVWQEEQILTPGNTTASDFGQSVDINTAGDVIVVGDYYASVADDEYGLVHIFTYDGTNWNQEILEAPDKSINYYFGISVAVKGEGKNVLAAGDYYGALDEQGNVLILDLPTACTSLE